MPTWMMSGQCYKITRLQAHKQTDLSSSSSFTRNRLFMSIPFTEQLSWQCLTLSLSLFSPFLSTHLMFLPQKQNKSTLTMSFSTILLAVMAEGKIRVEDHLVDANNKPIQVKHSPRIMSLLCTAHKEYHPNFPLLSLSPLTIVQTLHPLTMYTFFPSRPSLTLPPPTSPRTTRTGPQTLSM